ncbi:hypothetical protein [Aminobacter sp. SR38]|uniref:hypothetical protein n=1 Tax=Aminobacter TaxID=31988 RepID=UPI001AEEBFCF|nr:hypothetical protein [Aminobacter sp. SR38]
MTELAEPAIFRRPDGFRSWVIGNSNDDIEMTLTMTTLYALLVIPIWFVLWIGARRPDALVRNDRRRPMSALIARLGSFPLAEEAFQDALVSAVSHWSRNGVPAFATRLAAPGRLSQGGRPHQAEQVGSAPGR